MKNLNKSLYLWGGLLLLLSCQRPQYKRYQNAIAYINQQDSFIKSNTVFSSEPLYNLCPKSYLPPLPMPCFDKDSLAVYIDDVAFQKVTERSLVDSFTATTFLEEGLLPKKLQLPLTNSPNRLVFRHYHKKYKMLMATLYFNISEAERPYYEIHSPNTATAYHYLFFFKKSGEIRAVLENFELNAYIDLKRMSPQKDDLAPQYEFIFCKQNSQSKYGVLIKETGVKVACIYDYIGYSHFPGYLEAINQDGRFLLNKKGERLVYARAVHELTAGTQALYLPRRPSTNEIKQLTKCKQIKMLSISGLATYPKELKKLRNLEYLSLKNGQLTAIEGVSELKQLKYLDLEQNKLRQLPKEIEACTKLIELDLRANELALNKQLISLPQNLEILNLSSNQLTKIRINRNTLNKLRVLDLSQNSIKNLSEIIPDLIEIEEISLFDNQLKNEDVIFLDHPKLAKINLAFNKLDRLPIGLNQVKTLNELNLSGNQLKIWPRELRQLQQLKEVNLSQNQLEELPINLLEYKFLDSLKLNGNPLNKQAKQLYRLFSQ